MSDYPANMTLKPIVAWPHAETTVRERSNFSAPWRATLDLLDREIFHLGKGGRRPDSVLQIALRERDFRLTDGMPRADAKPGHPGVILNVESRHGALSYPCDKFDRWQDNLRAIALGLEALRKVSRYGIVQGSEQYLGFRAIEAKPAAEFANPADALVYLAEVARWDHPPELFEAAAIFRAARAATHPDRGGDRTVWDRVERAGNALRRVEWLP